MKVLVTGAHGFVGRHLSRELKARGHELVEPLPPPEPGALELTARASVHAALAEVKPDAVVHLAAASSVAQSHREPERTFEVNTLGTVNLLAATRASAPRARVLLVSSCEVYGRSAVGTRLREDSPLAPLSPYAAAKAAAELAALQYHRSYGLDVVCARPFAHIGPGQAAHFVIPSFASRIAAIRSGNATVVTTGDLSPCRDFLHVTDVVAAYALLLERGEAGAVYNVASGTGRTVQSLLDEMFALANVAPRCEVDPGLLRPIEIPELVGDATRLHDLGWSPNLDVTRALTEVLAEQGAIEPNRRA